MARIDAIVLGAGIVGTCIGLHLAKRGLAVALLDRRQPGMETSYGNAGIIESNTLLPHPFPSGWGRLLRIGARLASDADYHAAFLPRAMPWLWSYRAHSAPRRRIEFAQRMRPMFERALSEHEALLGESGAEHLLRKAGWLKLYRTDAAFTATSWERDLAGEHGLSFRTLDVVQAKALEPALAPVFRHAVHWPTAASVTDPLAVTRAYAARLAALGGVVLTGDARSLRRHGSLWRVDADEGPVDAREAVVALGPWTPDVLVRLGIKLPMAVKRGYHLHFRPRADASLTRPVVDVEPGYCIAPMQQGLRITTGAEIAHRDAPATPRQLARVVPVARSLARLGEPIEDVPWMGSRPCFADSRPVIGRAPGQAGLWLAFGHAHWGLTLGPVTGRLIAEMVAGDNPFCDPTPYRAERFAA
jgi:D-amino-acid dehydrogenase